MTQEHDNTQRIAQLSVAQRALLDKWLQSKAAQSPPAQATIPRRTEGDAWPLSFPQQRLWLVDQLDPGTAVYNMPGIVHLSGQLDVAVLERSLNEIIRRHESLRTSFVQSTADDGAPMQRVDSAAQIPLQRVDLRDLPVTEQSAAIQDRALAEARQPFDLATGPLLRITLLELSADEHVLLLTLHHIIADGWSIGVFVRELSELYTALIADKPSPLADLPVQYADYAVWQRQQARGTANAEHLDYWKQQLANLPTLQLPTDRPRPAFQTFAGAKHRLRLTARLTQELRALGQHHDATLFMTLLAAFNVLLQRYTDQVDLVVGSVNAGRPKRELDGLIGCFVDNLVLRTNLSGNPSFRELLRRVRETALNAYAHQDVPFEQLVETIQPDRDLSHSPLFQVMFVLQPGSLSTIELPQLKLTLEEGATGTTKFDLTLSLEERGAEIYGFIEYNTALFEAGTIARMASHFQMLLSAIVANPEERIAYVPLLTEAEQQSLIAWNRSEADYPRDASVHKLIEAQAARNPEVSAIVYEGAALTYAELNVRANQLAHHLRAQGVGPDVLVALCVERSLEMIVGMLAILKAGGAYVPLDPAYPAERLEYMLAHSRAPVILTQATLVERLPEHQAQVFRLDADWPTLAEQPTTNPPRVVLPDHLAYIIFTSGSTGRPKGVMVTQQGLINLVYGLRAYFDDPAVRQVGLITSISFDISVNQIFPTLIFGRTLHIIPDAVKFNSQALLRYLDTEQIHLLDAVPSYLQAILNALAEQPANALRYLLIGGERLEQRLLQSVFGQLGPAVQIVNIYGLTEISDINILGVIRAADIDKPITAGTPLQNNRVYILDRYSQPQPVGIAGEICIAGESVSRGYLFRPELTAERFVACPFEDGQLMVRTGDLGRWRADGTVEILGRIDHQVKVRGFRIETGEIEAVLVTHPSIAECVVVVHEDGQGEKRLVAYVEPRTKNLEPRTGNTRSPSPTATEAEAHRGSGQGEGRRPEDEGFRSAELRQLLGQRLPDYMVPAAFVTLAALPKTPNGKIDRNALPAPGFDSSQLEAGYVAPRTVEEELLARMWAQVLGVEQVGIHDNFFAQGGHSLLATQIASRVRDTFQLELPLRTLFVAPTIAGLAAWIAGQQREQHGLVPPLHPLPRDHEPPLSFAQQRLWFLDQLQPGSATYGISAAVRFTGALDVAALQRSLNAVAQRHEVLRTTFVRSNPTAEPVQRIAPAAELPLMVQDLSQLSAEDREAKLQQELAQAVQQPFDLAAGPLLRALVVRLDHQQHVLLLTLHHIIADGWSMGVLVREIGAYYTATTDAQSAALPELPIQYADYAIWQRDWLSGDVLERQLAFWRRQLAGTPPVLELPTDRPRPSVPTFRGAAQPVTFSPALTDAIKQLSQREGVTPFMLLLAAFQTLLSHYSNQEDVIVGSPIANRNLSATEGLIGFFVNTLVLRGDLSGNPSFRELLRRIRTTTLAAYAHQDLPFEQLVEELRPVRDPSYTPLFQVMFALQNAPLPDVALVGLEAQRMDLPVAAAKFDLDLALEETPDGLAGMLAYSIDLFDAATIDRMVQHFTILLESLVAEPERRIFDLVLLTNAERTLMLDSWNQTRMSYPEDRCVHQLFEAQAERSPDVVAVEYNGQSLSYAELNRRANQLAQYLRAQGVGPELRVGLCAERSLEMVIGFLGILKAGGVYVPLDPAYPEDRLGFMLADSKIRLLLTQTQLLHAKQSWHTDHQIRYVCLDSDWPEIADEPTTNIVPEITPDNLAYIIYTSGSTGQPKGVMLSHRGLVNLQAVQGELSELKVGRRLLQFTSASFDTSIWELSFALLSGATLCLADRHDLLPGPNLNRLLRERAITNALLLPSALAILPTEHLSQLKTILTGAEKLSAEVLARWGDGRRLLNGYGPTETTIYSTVFVCGTASPSDPPIGRPIGNTEVYLLNTYGQPVPIGVIGEIYIGGVGVSRGYHRRPDLTAERFVPNPFGDQPGARLYRTGDLGRYLPDGNMLYVGRRDDQVKVRGYRIELGEIEHVLTAHDDVRTGIVQIRETGGEKQLVAYVLPEPNCTPNISSLRNFLATKLPEYMVPNTFMILDELPLTPNGKIDYRALPLPDGTRPNLAAAYVAPRTELEQRIASIWQELLGVDQVGLHDNFFDLGGHSLLVIQLHGKLNEHLGSTLSTFNSVSMLDLFKYPTISALSEYLSQAATGNAAPAPPENQHKAAKEGRNWLKQRLGKPQRSDNND